MSESSSAPSSRESWKIPRVLTGFVGRDAEVARLAALLRSPEVRLLTIVGPGGVGKTRLAIEVAQAVSSACNEIAFVALASTNDPERVPAVIAQVLALEPRADRSAVDAIASALRDRPLLLILDNLEHLLPAGLVVTDLLEACPLLTILATSRTRLDLSAERVFPLDVLAGDDARTLFRQRLRAQREGRADIGNDATIDAICTRLDRMPLAIELAAARVATLPPEILLDRLAQPLSVLRNGPRDTPLRHQTMRDTIAWSYDLLDEAQKVGFRRLAVFVGGFTLEGAQAVLGGEQDALDLVAFLVQRSLVVPMAGDFAHPRFTMLESIRQFGVDELAASGEDDAIRAMHADWLIALVEHAIPFYDGPRLYEFFSIVRDEMDNIRAAMSWSLARQDGIRANRLSGGAWRHWQSGDATWLRTYDWNERMNEGLAWCERALAIRATVPSRYLLESIAGKLYIAQLLGHYAGLDDLADELLRRAQEVDDPLAAHWAWLAKAVNAQARGDWDIARGHLNPALEAARCSRDPVNQIAAVWCNRSLLELRAGDLRAAELAARQALAHALGSGNPTYLQGATAFLMLSLFHQQRWPEAAHFALENLRYLAMVRDVARTFISLEVLADAALVAHRPRDAVLLMAHARTVPHYYGKGLYDPDAIERRVRNALSGPAGEVAWQEGAQLRLDEGVRIGKEIAEVLALRSPVQHRGSCPGSLSQRETEVLGQLVHGKSNRAIGDALFISERTVERHISHIMLKLDLDSRTGIVAWAVRNGIAG